MQPRHKALTVIGLSSAVLLATALSGCMSVADDPTVPGFAAAAGQAKDTFETARQGEADAFLGEAIAEASANGRILAEHCLNVKEAADCHLTITVGGQPIDTDAVGVNLAKDAAKLTAYANDLKELAAAKDLTDQRAALQKFATSIGGVLQAAGLPGLGSVDALVADLVQQAKLQRRREELIRISEAADHSVQTLAGKLETTTTKLQSNIVVARSQIVSNLQAQYLSLAANDPRRPALARQLLDATQSERAAASLKVDFSALGAAHTKMIESLRNPKADLKSAIAEFTSLEKEFEAVRTAVAPSGGKAST